MANFKRRKTRRNVRCTMCTQARFLGNNKGRFKAKEEAFRKADAFDGKK
jgi:hypothetical protein